MTTEAWDAIAPPREPPVTIPRFGRRAAYGYLAGAAIVAWALCAAILAAQLPHFSPTASATTYVGPALRFGAEWAAVSLLCIASVGVGTGARPRRALRLILALALGMAAVAPRAVRWGTDQLADLPVDAVIIAGVMAQAFAVERWSRAARAQVVAEQLRAELAQTELAILRAQLQPHFIFNALNSIVALLRTDAAGARGMLARLSDLLRGSANPAGDALVPLERELAFVASYVDLETLRYGDRLAVEFEIDPALASAVVPTLVLQPLVENAIRHGIAPTREPGRVAIRAFAAPGARISLVVEDDGAGFAAGASAAGFGIGLASTRARLWHLYGDAAELAVASAAGSGTRIIVTFPLRFGA